jgi:hypothetical protein
MQLLFWRLIEESKASGVESIDFGRSDLVGEGLVTFKDRLGARKKMLTYFRYPRTEKRMEISSWSSQAVRQCFNGLPDIAFSAAGRILYRHMG